MKRFLAILAAVTLVGCSHARHEAGELVEDIGDSFSSALEIANEEHRPESSADATPLPPPPYPAYTDLPGWKLNFVDYFNTDAPEGQFVALYGLKFGTYNNGDTSKRGLYSPQYISVANGVLQERLFTSSDGVHHVAAILPKLSTVGKRGDVLSGRFTVRWRADRLHSYKIAWLLWPYAGCCVDGEIDGPEHNLDTVIKGYMHPQGGTATQTRFVSTVYGGDWHEWTQEWVAGKSVKMFIDGVQVGPTATSLVPKNLMHWVLQTETILNKAIPIDSAEVGTVQIDSVAYWVPV